MKRRQFYYFILLILITSSCNNFKNGNLFSSRQGKNKVMDRDFEAQEDFEEDNRIAEREMVQAPVESVQQKIIATCFTEEFTTASVKNEEKFDAPFEIVDDNKTLETSSSTNQNLVSENVVERKQERPARTRSDFMPVVLILILAAFALVFVIGLFAFLGW